MKTVIYEKQMPVASWFALALGFVGASVIILTGGKNVPVSMGMLIGAAIVLVALSVLTTGMLARHQLARLSMSNGELEAQRFSMIGRGKTLVFHHTETSGWRWKSKPATGVKTAVLAFTYNGEEYFMPFSAAKVTDHAAFRELAPFLLWA